MIHFSKTKATKLTKVNQTGAEFKPNGLWYSTDDKWIQYYTKNINKIKQCKYIYKISIKYTTIERPNKNRVLKITNEKVFDEFTIKYGYIRKAPMFEETYFMLINWSEVEKDYGGIEIIPLIQTRMFESGSSMPKNTYGEKFNFGESAGIMFWPKLIFWQKSLDIDSGCIWNPKSISNFERTYEF